MFKKEIIKTNEMLCGIIKWVAGGFGAFNVIVIISSLAKYSSINYDFFSLFSILLPNIVYIIFSVIMVYFNYKTELFFKELSFAGEEEILSKKELILKTSVAAIFFSLIITGVLGIIYYCFLPDSRY
jgi:hypothetical protein